MPITRLLLHTFLLMTTLWGPVLAATTPDLAALQQQLDQLADRKLSDTDRLQAGQLLERAIQHTKRAAEVSAALKTLQKEVANAPGLQAEAERELKALTASEPTDVVRSHRALPLDKLETLLAERSVRLEELRQKLNEVTSQVIAGQTAPERVQGEITANQARLKVLGSEPTTGEFAPLARDAEIRHLEARNQYLLESLSTNNTLLELGRARRALLLEKISLLTDEVQVLQGLINEKRKAESEKLIASLWQEAGTENANALLAPEIDANSQLSDLLRDTTNRLAAVTQENLAARQFLDNLERADTTLDELIGALDSGLLLARILHQQRDALPKVSIDEHLTTDIAELRLKEFELNQQQEQLARPADYVARLLADEPPGVATEALRTALTEVIGKRQELLNLVQSQLNALLNEAINLQLSQRTITTTSRELRLKIDQQLFWIPSNRPLGLEWLKAFPARLMAQVSGLPYTDTAAGLWLGIGQRPLPIALLVLACLGLLAAKSRLRDWLTSIQFRIGSITRDSQRHTPLALAVQLLFALPGTLLLAALGVALAASGKGEMAGLASACKESALIWLVFYFAYRLVAPDGVAERHFRWSAARCQFLRRRVRDIGLVVLVLRFTATLVAAQPSIIGEDSAGLVIVAVSYLLLAALLPGLAWRKEHKASALRLMSAVLLAAIPLALAGAVASGYYYTTLKLTSRLTDTLSLLVLWWVAEATLVRSLALAAQRLEYSRARKQLEQDQQVRERDAGEGAEIIEQPMLNIDQVNQQSLRLARLGLLSLFAVLLWMLWADLITLFSYLDTIVLYEQFSGTGDNQVAQAISLQDVGGALLIAVIAFILAGNLPGLLEIAVLSRLNLAQGSAYATTTLLSYVIFGIGFVTALSALGVSWDKLQWLVAALSVGLGFGLQEIFANFVSGIIILFERPVRIGDVVTIGNLSGTVTKMRIRATTITDFDHKEIIVPNKVFVTEQLINWSLTDTVTRVKVLVGVAYGSDLKKTRELLLQAATENPRVLKEPPPVALFLSFGTSTLDHELRLHVRELGDRNLAIDEINRRIDELFREHGITIAFNHVDVRIVDGSEENPGRRDR